MRISLAGGRIAAIDPGVPPLPDDDRCATLLPGMPNLHSHAFQRLMAGLAETRTGPAGDDFWGWRTLMYRLVGSITPDDLAAIAAMAFCEMVESGFTRVGEFQYLHHQPDGRPYADPAAMAAALAQAAEATGIALTLLPVFYAHAGFGGTPPQDGQRRFVTGLDEFATLLDASRRAVATLGDAVVGVAPHSLRAVTPEELALLATMAPDAPLHLHIAEQRREVADCIAWSGQRPVDWLLSHHAVDARWCLVHATHVTAQECSALAASGATVGLCPVTEANLGDGIFPAAAFVGAGGRFGIGSDSNVRIDLAEELRLLEYGQRLTLERRAVLVAGVVERADDVQRGTGRRPCGAGRGPANCGRRACRSGRAAPRPRDAGDRALDGWIFARGSVERVWRAGREVVRDGRHTARDAIEAGFADVLRRRLP
ncbi:formimidoylglutamate deiminase [Sphingomonas hankookensis]|uniref:formimidoylglutamate deiminase n=1 Tax=Sphingomonas hankookensis TaxID=563996 RepID=UPI003D3021EF